MDKPVYPITEIEPLVFRFDSIGPKGIVRKFVVYQPTSVANEFNLALLDYTNGRFDDMAVSGNDDMEKVLATVVQTFDCFFGAKPDAGIVFTGSDASRTRLYRIAISQNQHLADEKFYIYGRREDVYEPFRANQPYDPFLTQQKHGSDKA